MQNSGGGLDRESAPCKARPCSDARELEDLVQADRARLAEEAVIAGQAVRALGEAVGFAVAKLNVASLGNVTPQLHLHVVGRRPGDAAWPGPVWGVGAASPYGSEALRLAREAALGALAG